MASQAPSRSKNNNRSRNRNRGGGKRSNSNRGGGGSGGGGRGRYYREKVPRAPKKKTFWEKILAFFGGDSDSKKKPQGRKPASAASRTSQKPKPKANPAGASQQQKSRRTPEVVEVTSTRLYVGNLSYDASEEDLEELFRGVGTVQAAEVVSHRRTQRSKGYAFVIMNSVDEAKRAVDELHDKDFMGRKLVVSGAKSGGPREEDEAA